MREIAVLRWPGLFFYRSRFGVEFGIPAGLAADLLQILHDKDLAARGVRAAHAHALEAGIHLVCVAAAWTKRGDVHNQPIANRNQKLSCVLF